MKIAIIGYGRMGRMVEKATLSRGHEITARIDADNRNDFDSEGFLSADVAIEFTTPASAPDNILEALRRKVAVVSGSTGWNSRREAIEAECRKLEGALLTSSNFSIGMNIFMEINRRLTSLMSAFGEYSPRLREIHHIHKLDHPSGTAVTLADDLISLSPVKERWEETLIGDEKTLPVTVEREGEVCGIHEISWVSHADKISIRHEAFNREGFALGAVLAAEWLNGKKGIYGMGDVMESLTDNKTI